MSEPTQEHIKLAVDAYWTAHDRDDIQAVVQAIADTEARGYERGVRAAAERLREYQGELRLTPRVTPPSQAAIDAAAKLFDECADCDGVGYNNEDPEDDPCLRCDGTGKTYWAVSPTGLARAFDAYAQQQVQAERARCLQILSEWAPEEREAIDRIRSKS